MPWFVILFINLGSDVIVYIQLTVSQSFSGMMPDARRTSLSQCKDTVCVWRGGGCWMRAHAYLMYKLYSYQTSVFLLSNGCVTEKNCKVKICSLWVTNSGELQMFPVSKIRHRCVQKLSVRRRSYAISHITTITISKNLILLNSRS
jgi:hypothetical protein